ncbi:MAG: hypothetical protein ACI9MR_002856 [Myxococcota bacterium]|jgi:hypothetical protein
MIGRFTGATLVAAAAIVASAGCSTKSPAGPAAGTASVEGVAVQISCLAEGDTIAVPITGADVCDGKLQLGYTNTSALTAHLRVARQNVDGSVIVGKSITLTPTKTRAPLTPELLDRAGAVKQLYLSVSAEPESGAVVNKAITGGTLAPRYERPPPFD